MKYSLRSQDEAELTRLCGHLEAIHGRGGLSDDEAAALKRATCALAVVFFHGLRTEVDRLANSDGSLTSEQQEHLRQLGINPDADTP
jgi:hypothetical protein